MKNKKLSFFTAFLFTIVSLHAQTTKQVKQKMNEMQRNMNEHMKQQTNSFNSTPPENTSTKKSGDYISPPF